MIRYLENNEKQNIRPLYEHCFDDTKEYTDYYFQNRLPGNHVIVNERDNKIVNCVHLIPYHLPCFLFLLQEKLLSETGCKYMDKAL